MNRPTDAAQAVLEAVRNAPALCADSEFCAGEAIRAVADLVVPWREEPTEESVGSTVDFGYAWALFSQANDIRQELIAIADEIQYGPYGLMSPEIPDS